MKRILALGCSIALAAMLLAGCGNGGNNEQPSGGEGTGIAVEDVKVGVIHIGDPATGSGYSYTHDQGIVAMQETRAVADELETLTAKKCWPFPTYGDILFSV